MGDSLRIVLQLQGKRERQRLQESVTVIRYHQEILQLQSGHACLPIDKVNQTKF